MENSLWNKVASRGEGLDPTQRRVGRPAEPNRVEHLKDDSGQRESYRSEERHNVYGWFEALCKFLIGDAVPHLEKEVNDDRRVVYVCPDGRPMDEEALRAADFQIPPRAWYAEHLWHGERTKCCPHRADDVVHAQSEHQPVIGLVSERTSPVDDRHDDEGGTDY